LSLAQAQNLPSMNLGAWSRIAIALVFAFALGAVAVAPLWSTQLLLARE